MKVDMERLGQQILNLSSSVERLEELYEETMCELTDDDREGLLYKRTEVCECSWILVRDITNIVEGTSRKAKEILDDMEEETKEAREVYGLDVS